MSDIITITIRYVIDRDGYHYSGGINLSEEEYKKITPEEINKIKEEQFSSWVKAITTIPEPIIVPVVEQIIQITDQITSLQGQLSNLEPQLENLIEIKKKEPEAMVDAQTSVKIDNLEEI